MLLLVVLDTSVIDSLLDIFTEGANLRPWAGGLETLGNDVVEEAEISNISDHVGKLITLDSIFSSTRKTIILFGDLEHISHH